MGQSVNLLACTTKGLLLCHLGVANDRPGGHQQAQVHRAGLGWCHLHPVHQNVTALLGTPGESSKAAVHHHQNAPRRRNPQGVVFRFRLGQPLALVCMPRQWAVLRLGGCVSGNHMWCGHCLVMPHVKRRHIGWNQIGHHVLKGRDTTRINGPRHSPERMLLLLLLQCGTSCTRSPCDCGKGLGLHTQSTSHLSASGGICGLQK